MNVSTNLKAAADIRTAPRATNMRDGLEMLEGVANDFDDVRDALETLMEASGERAQSSCARLLKEVDEFEPCVTLVGQVKSGKTSLVNALAGWNDLLPSDVNPWTSVVTSLHLMPSGKPVEKAAKFQFMSESDWDRLLTKGGRIGEMAERAGAEGELTKIRDQIEMMREKSRRRLGRKFEMLMGQSHEYGFFDKNMIERYICLGDNFEDEEADQDDKGRFADITKAADLYLSGSNLPVPICLRDTPGVNDTFMMREQVTIRALRDSRLCVVVLSASQALSSVDMALFRMITNLASREVIIFVNRIDELSDPISQIPEIEASIRQTLKDNDGPENPEIIFGSAYWANKVIADELQDMTSHSAETLLEWAGSRLPGSDGDDSPYNMIWDLSGMPALFRAISERIAEDLAAPLLRHVASAGVNIGTSRTAAKLVRVQGESPNSDANFHETKAHFERTVEANIEALGREVDEVFAMYHQRADRALGKFIDRATHALLKHLEKYGTDAPWEYNPSGLRSQMRSAYSIMATRVRSKAGGRFEAAVEDIAEVLYSGFGKAIEGIQIAVPEVPRPSSPVALGQTIVLDLDENWWSSWWRRLRGFKAFERKFRGLILSETEEFMTQAKYSHTSDARELILERLKTFFNQQRDLLYEIGTPSPGGGSLADVYEDGDQIELEMRVEDAVLALQEHAS